MDATSKLKVQKKKTWPLARALGLRAGTSREEAGGGETLEEDSKRGWMRGGKGADSPDIGRGTTKITDAQTWVLVLALPLVCCVNLGEPFSSLGLTPHLKKVRLDTKWQRVNNSTYMRYPE